MLTGCTKAYSSSCSQLSVYFQLFRRTSFLECALQPKIAKITKNHLFCKFRVFHSHRCWYDWKACH